MSVAPSEPYLPDASDDEFAHRIGLDLRVREQRALYSDMKKQEARRGFERLCHDRNSVFPHLRNDPSIRAPYTVTQITESALRRETRRIHTIAKASTSQIYDIGIVPGRVEEGSWIIRWLLWNAIRTGGNTDICLRTDIVLELNLAENGRHIEQTWRKRAPGQDSNKGEGELRRSLRVPCSIIEAASAKREF